MCEYEESFFIASEWKRDQKRVPLEEQPCEAAIEDSRVVPLSETSL